MAVHSSPRQGRPTPGVPVRSPVHDTRWRMQLLLGLSGVLTVFGAVWSFALLVAGLYGSAGWGLVLLGGAVALLAGGLLRMFLATLRALTGIPHTLDTQVRRGRVLGTLVGALVVVDASAFLPLPFGWGSLGLLLGVLCLITGVGLWSSRRTLALGLLLGSLVACLVVPALILVGIFIVLSGSNL